MDVWNYILGYRNTLKSVFEIWVVHIPFNKFQKTGVNLPFGRNIMDNFMNQYVMSHSW